MKELLEKLLSDALAELKSTSVIPQELSPKINVSRTRDASHGDFACNIAMMLAKPAGLPPRDLAQKVIDALPASDRLSKAEVAGPGFINFFMQSAELHSVLPTILSAKETYGRSEVGAGQKVQVEFVSANPTGPLHVGHGRGAAIGTVIGNLLDAVGYQVQREYYVNDAGRQIDILSTSVWLRYLEHNGEQIPFPSNAYQGQYIYDIARELNTLHGDALMHPVTNVFSNVPADEPDGGDKEAHIDAVIANAKALLGDKAYTIVFDLTLTRILDDIRADLSEFGVHYDNWFSERSLKDDVKDAIALLKKQGNLYQKEGAWWLRSTDFGDEKDRVVVRENGETTYFASDIAYLKNKFDRGFDHILYVFGADHHGYVGRMLAVCEALGLDKSRIEFLLIQFANLFSSGERQQMSTRSGQFVTIRQLRDDVGKDAARYFYVMRRYQQHLEFDLDLAKSESKDNPVYYVQYAHARICSVMRQAREKGYDYGQDGQSLLKMADLSLLSEPHETELLTLLASFPERLERAARAREPHQITTYLQELANTLNKYYEAHKWLIEDDTLRNARLCLILAARQVLANGLELLDVSAPEVL